MKKIINNIIYILGVILAILIIIFRKKLVIIVLIASIFSFLIGLLLIAIKNVYGYLCAGIGLSTFLGWLFYKFEILMLNDAVTFVMALTLASTITIAYIIEIIRARVNLKIHSLEVEAEVIDLQKVPNVKKDLYYPVFGYVIDKKSFEVDYLKIYKKKIPEIGDKKKIFINPYDHFDVYFAQEKKDKIYIFCCYTFLVIMAVLIIVGLFR